MLMSPDLFLDCILYIINENTEQSCRQVLDLIALYDKDTKNTSTSDHDVTRFYIRILKTIIESKVTKKNPDELRIILLKFQSDPILSKRKEIYQLLNDTFISQEEMAPEKIVQYSDRIQNVLIWHRCNQAAKAMYASLARAGDMVNPQHQIAEMRKLVSVARDIDTVFTNEPQHKTSIGSIIERIDMTNKDSMKAALVKNNERSVAGVLRLGLQGLNRMLGSRGGLTRGESLIFYALPHNYKSGLLMSVAGWVALYNVPVPTEENAGKKALILLISLENEAYQNFVWLYRHHYETTHQASSAHLTDDQVADWSHEVFSANGYTLIIERHLPAKFNYPQFTKTIEEFENSGFYIALVALDYPNLMAKDGITERAEGGNYLAVRALFSALCNYTKTKGITFVGAHPLSREAKKLASSGITNIVKRLDQSHIADSFDVAREVDLEIFVHIERNLDGVSYLTMQRGKHRYVDTTPLAHQYCAYRFHRLYGIRDDILLPSEAIADIFSDAFDMNGERGMPYQPTETDTISVAVF